MNTVQCSENGVQCSDCSDRVQIGLNAPGEHAQSLQRRPHVSAYEKVVAQHIQHCFACCIVRLRAIVVVQIEAVNVKI